MPICPECSEPVLDTDSSCPACGALLPSFGESGLPPEGEEMSAEIVVPDVTAAVRSTLEGLFLAAESLLPIQPDVDITVIQAARGSYCSVCGGYHPQTELFLCPACRQEVGLDHKVESLEICSRCAERAFEIAMCFTPVPDVERRYYLSVASNLTDTEWTHDKDFDVDDLSHTWEDHLAMISDREEIPERTLIDQVGRPLLEAVLDSQSWSTLAQPFETRAEWQEVHFKLVDLPPELACWPWEFLSLGNDFLALSRRTPVMRWTCRNRGATLGPENGPLRVLLVASQCSCADASPSRTEADLLKVGLEETDIASLIRVEPFDVQKATAGSGPTLADGLHRHLQSHYHILHLAGEIQVEFSPDGEAAILVLQEGGLRDRLHLETLGHWLEESSVQVIVAGCRFVADGQAVSPLDPRLALEDTLLRGRVTAVIAFQFDLLADQARDFAQAFYVSLAARCYPQFPRPGLPEALAAGRKALLDPDAGASTRAWAAPVLWARPVEAGVFLDLEQVGEEAVEEETLGYEPFVVESLPDLDPQEAPLCTEQALEKLRQQRVQLIVAEPDAGAFELAQQLAFKLLDTDEVNLVLRFPRYEALAGFMPGLRNLVSDKERLAVLFDTKGWERSTEELDDIVRLIKTRSTPVYVLLAVSVESPPDIDAEFGLWLQKNQSLCTRLSDKDYSAEILQHTLSRILQQARESGQLHPSTAHTVLEYAETGHLFGQGDLRISLPGKLVRFVYGQLMSQPAISSAQELEPVLHALSDAREDVRRWFSERLNNSQRVLVMSLALLQGLPTHIFPTLYRQIALNLRRAFHLDLSALPVRAELRRWSLYLHEVRRATDGMREVSFIEFVSELAETEILNLLHQDYSEWLIEAIPLMSDAARGSWPIDKDSPTWSEYEQRSVQLAVTRALGEIGRSSRRALDLVASDVERWLVGPRTELSPHGEHQLRAVPGHILRYIADAGDRQLETEIITTLARWRQHKDHRLRWVAASACGRLARAIAPKRLLPVYVALANDTREASHRTFQRASRRASNARQAAAEPEYKAAVEVYQAVTYALRMFSPDEFEALRRVYDQAAGDSNWVVRTNTAIALDQVAAARPDVAAEAIRAWGDPEQRTGSPKWASWWTASAAATLLIEHERQTADQARDLLAHLLTMSQLLAESGTPQAIERIASDLVWAMGVCTGRETEPSVRQMPLARTLAQLGSLLGEDPWPDRVICAVFERAGTADPRQQVDFVNAAFDVMQSWLRVKDYRLTPTWRKVAIQAYLNAGSSRASETGRLLRELAQFEAYDYTPLKGRDPKTLDLDWLGVGGLMLQTILDGGQPSLARALPLLRTMASIKEPFVRSFAPFVLVGLARVYPAPVVETLATWSKGPQWTIQLSTAETALSLCLFGLGSRDILLDVLTTLARTASSDTRAYLESRLGDLATIDLPAATRLRTVLDENEAME